ncbi:homocysteine S-methyltransferase family protein [Luminiphilus sp.]|nr:homocysteine S-methyltransferase family protein [Luminiphilus sp.]
MTHTVLLLDGGLGQELIRRSPDPAHHHWSLQVMLEEPDLVSEVHRDFCLAGAQIACLNTYAVTRARLARGKGLAPLATHLNRARELAQKGIEAANAPDTALISSLPPLVASYRADTQLPFEQMVDEYRELIALQMDSVDGFIAETIPSIAEAKAVLTAAAQSDTRIVLGLTVTDDNGLLLRSGESLSDTIEAIADWHPLAVVINCSKPEAVSQALPVLAQAGCPFGAYANGFTAIDALEPGGVVDVLEARNDLNPDQYALFAAQWLDMGATIIGGCCEVGPAHISALHRLINERGLTQAGWQALTSE